MPIKSLLHLGVKGRKQGLKKIMENSQGEPVPNQTKPNLAKQLPTPSFLKFLFSPALPVYAWILKSWNWTGRGHRMSQRTLRSQSCNWQSWESNLGLNSWSCILSQTCPALNIPSSAKHNLYLWEIKYTLYSKNNHSHSECLIMLKTGQIIGFTHTVSFETQITNIQLPAISKPD